jgi:hypothetical protein
MCFFAITDTSPSAKAIAIIGPAAKTGARVIFTMLSIAFHPPAEKKDALLHLCGSNK